MACRPVSVDVRGFDNHFAIMTFTYLRTNWADISSATANSRHTPAKTAARPERRDLFRPTRLPCPQLRIDPLFHCIIVPSSHFFIDPLLLFPHSIIPLFQHSIFPLLAVTSPRQSLPTSQVPSSSSSQSQVRRDGRSRRRMRGSHRQTRPHAHLPTPGRLQA